MNSSEALLSQLRGIQAPDVSAVPAPGWWLLAVIALLVAVALGFLARQYKRLAWRREARAELERIRSQVGRVNASESLSGVSRLVRRVALVARPREDVASLEGDAWLAALDDIGGNSLFSNGFGQLLDQGPYQPDPQLDEQDLEALMDVVAKLIDAVKPGNANRVST